MTTFFTADLHLGHGNIMKYCQRLKFMTPEEAAIVVNGNPTEVKKLHISQASVDRHDNWIIDQINALVRPTDELRFVGDFCWCRDNYELIKFYRNRIYCRNFYMVYGNHDKRTREFFTQANDKITITVNGQKIQLNHEAMAIWDCRHYGAWHLYGHSHGRAEKWLDEIMPGRYSMDVGIDNAFNLVGEYRPFSFEEIAKIFSTRSGFGLLSREDS